MQMNIPFEFWSLDKYRATLAHKVNHSFRAMNSEFNLVYHPRFGWIRGIHATRPISRGEEVLCHYGYEVDGNTLNPQWYLNLYEQEVGPLPPKAPPTT